MPGPLKISIQGRNGAGKTIMLRELETYLTGRGWKVQAFDNVRHTDRDAAEPIYMGNMDLLMVTYVDPLDDVKPQC